MNVELVGFLVENEKFIAWLEEEMAARDWRPADLARAAGVYQSTLANVLNGLRNPGPEVLTAIAKGLNLPPEYVFRRAGLLPTVNDDEPSFQEILEIMRSMDIEERRELVDYALWRLKRKGQ